VLEGIEAIVFRTIGDRPSLWESRLPPEVLRLPEELARVDALLDDPAFFAPFAPCFHPGRAGHLRQRERGLALCLARLCADSMASARGVRQICRAGYASAGSGLLLVVRIYNQMRNRLVSTRAGELSAPEQGIWCTMHN
jgi:hypothetical protein